ncbi:hypothetical protein HY638_05850 [Candidatus Woesearchaeota archaeon]|nr:hypothetical protein [Candidatus Woesearchaeota archaeon]
MLIKGMPVRERVGGNASSFDGILFEIQQSIVNINDLREKKLSVKGEVEKLGRHVSALKDVD